MSGSSYKSSIGTYVRYRYLYDPGATELVGSIRKLGPGQDVGDSGDEEQVGHHQQGLARTRHRGVQAVHQPRQHIVIRV